MGHKSGEAPKPGAQIIRSNQTRIIRSWEKNILKAIPAARQQNRSALRDHIPAILDELATTLDAGMIPAAAVEDAYQHGRQRSFAPAYTLDQVLSEFQLLRRAIFDVLEAERPLDRPSRELILEFLETAISESATEYVRLQFHQEQVARTAAEVSARRLKGLHNVTEAALVSDVSLDRLLNDLVERVRELFDADNAAILLLDASGQALEVRAASGLEAEIEKQPRVPVGQGMAGTIFKKGESRIINDLSRMEVVNQILRTSVKSALAAPLRLLGSPFGVVHVDTVNSHEFTRDDLMLLDLIADRIAVVIQHTRLLEAQRESEARLKLVSEVTPQMLWMSDPEGRVRYCNENWHEYTGLERPSLGLSWIARVDPQDHEAAATAWRQAQRTGSLNVELRIRGNNGQSRWFIVRAVPVKDALGQITEWAGSATDIEEQKRYQRLLEEERDQREQFVNTLTHDLRTPLTAAQMSARIISLRPHLVENVAKLATRILDGLIRVDRMIQDLLDVSRIRAGKPLQLTLEPCDLRTIAQACVDEARAVYGVAIELKGPSALEGHWSPGDLRRALENLLGNAIKYGDTSRPIAVTLSEEGDQARLSVHNWGEPIPVEEQASLFEPFSRAKAARAGQKKGWGLGLLLVYGVAHAHGGSVSVRSTLAEGTRFVMTLPKRP